MGFQARCGGAPSDFRVRRHARSVLRKVVSHSTEISSVLGHRPRPRGCWSTHETRHSRLRARLDASSRALEARRRGRRRPSSTLMSLAPSVEADFGSHQSNALFSRELRTASNVPLARRRALVGPEPDAFGLGFHRLIVIVGGLVGRGDERLALVCYVGLRALLLIALVSAVG